MSMARGDLGCGGTGIGRGAGVRRNHKVPWCFVSDMHAACWHLRGNFAEAERWFSDRTEIEERTISPDGEKPACSRSWAETDIKAGPAGESAGRRRGIEQRPRWGAWMGRPGSCRGSANLNPVGAWFALERSVIGLAMPGKKEGSRRATAAHGGVGPDRICGPCRIASLLFVAAAVSQPRRTGDWTAAEEHHLTAIHQTDTAGVRAAQPTATEWYVTMLLERKPREMRQRRAIC